MTDIKDVFWYEAEIEELTLNNGLLIEKITKLQEKIEHNLRRINELRNLIKKEATNCEYERYKPQKR